MYCIFMLLKALFCSNHFSFLRFLYPLSFIYVHEPFETNETIISQVHFVGPDCQILGGLRSTYVNFYWGGNGSCSVSWLYGF
ncbi:Uncharacterized protein TCM_039163 [Theobroma cacao]|uniref:Uncharacterized protein n=1 Tax=Theobroma cacao TaxID=3641 RepID=A0A061GPT4_THECC|nr:Uncharacterized protein TCM_039163 [Theobroma cacao]